MKKSYIFLFIIFFAISGSCLAASETASRLSGRILLQVEENGEAWYVNPDNLSRYFLGRPQDAFALMRSQGIGISDHDIDRIRPNLDHLSGRDSDADGLPDDFEIAFGIDPDKSDTDNDGYGDREEIQAGYDPAGKGAYNFDNTFSNIQKGKIFLQVERNGEAWYVSPTDNERYYLGRPQDAFAIMRALGLGITNIDLAMIDQDLEDINAGVARFNLAEMEKAIHDLVNIERVYAGLEPLVWNDALAAVARTQSRSLAQENEITTDIELICDYPIIHHENLNEGFTITERLDAGGVYDFEKNGENIALVAGGTFMFRSGPAGIEAIRVEECRDRLYAWGAQFKENLASAPDQAAKRSLLLAELEKRETQLEQETLMTDSINWRDSEEVMEEIVQGWMDSPGHRANILKPDFNQAGVGLAYVNGYIISTQAFTMKVDCGYLNGPCCERSACYIPLVCSESNICQ